ncbi:MAG TPA: hypothetical protein VFX96_16140 [Pyrinomonadaceae bacterium]|nr:hypothetical protein [Pyrinomonadaceae bacterium]
MTWVKASEMLPEENTQILIHDDKSNKIEFGRYVGGRWYVEEQPSGRLREVAGVTHWCFILDYMSEDDGDD